MLIIANGTIKLVTREIDFKPEKFAIAIPKMKKPKI